MSDSDASMSDAPAPVKGNKGKGRAATRDESDDSDEVSMQVDKEEDEDEQAFDMDQDPETRRKVRASLRAQELRVDKMRTNMAEVTIAGVTDRVKGQDALFKNVKTTSDAVIDSRTLGVLAGIGAEKARGLKLDNEAFDTLEWVSKLRSLMGYRTKFVSKRSKGKKGGNVKEEGDELDEDDEEFSADDEDGGWLGNELQWGRVGAYAVRYTKKAPTVEFMCGPMNIQVKERKVRVVQKREKHKKSDQTRPDEVSAADVEKNPMSTDRMVPEVIRVLEDLTAEQPIPLLQFLINPQSFSQSVENFFFLSFAVKENRIQVEWDDDRQETVCYCCDPPTDEEKADLEKSQHVFEFDMQTWREAIDAYGLKGKAPLIPHREAQHKK